MRDLYAISILQQGIAHYCIDAGPFIELCVSNKIAKSPYFARSWQGICSSVISAFFVLHIKRNVVFPRIGFGLPLENPRVYDGRMLIARYDLRWWVRIRESQEDDPSSRIRRITIHQGACGLLCRIFIHGIVSFLGGPSSSNNGSRSTAPNYYNTLSNHKRGFRSGPPRIRENFIRADAL